MNTSQFQLFAMCSKFSTEDHTADTHDASILITLKLLHTLAIHCKVDFPHDALTSFTTLRDSLGKEFSTI